MIVRQLRNTIYLAYRPQTKASVDRRATDREQASDTVRADGSDPHRRGFGAS